MLALRKEPEVAMLSPRECQIVKSLVAGLTNKQITDRLGLSTHTTNSYTRSIDEKLHVNSRGGAVAKAMRDHLV